MNLATLRSLALGISVISFESSFGSTASFSKEAVAQHAQRSDCWIVIENHVYDITRALQDHDRYKYKLDPWCGKDATEAWKTKDGKNKAHSRKANLQLQALRIGSLEK